MKINNKSELTKIKYFRRKLLDWYKENKRSFPWRENLENKYGCVVAEFLLKRTTATAVSRIYLDFIKKYPSWEKIYNTPEEDFQVFFKPLGLWKQRSKLLKNFAACIKENNNKIPSKREKIEALPGVGIYITNAILLFYFNRPEPLLDSNMARVIQRFFGLKDTKNIVNNNNKELISYANKIVKVKDPIDLNWAVLDFSAAVCHYRYPKCKSCVLNRKCTFFNQ